MESMRLIFLLTVALLFCLPMKADPPKDIGQFAIGAENYNKHEQWHISRKSSGTALWTSKWGRKLSDYEKVLPKEGTKSIHVTSITVDEVTGLATAIWEDGSIYRGQVYLEEMRGIGTIKNPDGSQYSGEWKWNLPNGKGTFITPDGIAYTTNFVGGVPHGKGVIQDLDGRMYSARWVRGVLKEKSIKPLKEKK